MIAGQRSDLSLVGDSMFNAETSEHGRWRMFLQQNAHKVTANIPAAESLVERTPRDEQANLRVALHAVEQQLAHAKRSVDTQFEIGDVHPSEELWRQIRQLLMRAVKRSVQNSFAVPTMPSVQPSVEGSIDLIWEKGDRRIILSLLGDPPNIATFFGRDRSSSIEVVSGEIDLLLERDRDWLLRWIED